VSEVKRLAAMEGILRRLGPSFRVEFLATGRVVRTFPLEAPPAWPEATEVELVDSPRLVPGPGADLDAVQLVAHDGTILERIDRPFGRVYDGSAMKLSSYQLRT
jgi:hypothetical protein